MQTVIEITDYNRKVASITRSIQGLSISSQDKQHIFDFVEDLFFTSKISPARRSKLLSTIKNIALKLDKEFKTITNQDVKRFVAEIQTNPEYTLWTKSDYLKISKRFFSWIAKRENLDVDVSWIQGRIKPKDLPRLKRSEMITEGEVKKLIDACEHPRDKAIFALIWDAGCRIGELGSMTIGSVHFEDRGTVVDFVGKTGKRSAFLIESTPYLVGWLNIHPFKDDRNAALWITSGRYKNRPLSYGMYYLLFKRIFEKAGVKKKFNPHSFRHSRALWCVQSGWNNVMANKMFGWGLNSNMYNYYVSLSTEDLKDKMLESYGLPSESKKFIEDRKPLVCPRCVAVNESKTRFCFKCGMALDMEIAKTLFIKQEQDLDLQGELFKKVLPLDLSGGDVRENLYLLLKSDKVLMEKFKKLIETEG